MEEQNIRMAIVGIGQRLLRVIKLPSMKSITTMLSVSIHSQARSSPVGATCKRFVAITLVDHRDLRSGGSRERVISGLPSM